MRLSYCGIWSPQRVVVKVHAAALGVFIDGRLFLQLHKKAGVGAVRCHSSVDPVPDLVLHALEGVRLLSESKLAHDLLL